MNTQRAYRCSRELDLWGPRRSYSHKFPGHADRMREHQARIHKDLAQGADLADLLAYFALTDGPVEAVRLAAQLGESVPLTVRLLHRAVRLGLLDFERGQPGLWRVRARCTGGVHLSADALEMARPRAGQARGPEAEREPTPPS